MRTDLTGNSTNPVDDKGRVSLPNKFRKLLSGVDLCLVRSEDPEFPYIKVYEADDYYEWINQFFEDEGGFRSNSLQHQRKKARLMNSTESVKLDGSYRIRIDPKLREYAKLGDKVKFIGMGDHVAIFGLDIAEELDRIQVYDD